MVGIRGTVWLLVFVESAARSGLLVIGEEDLLAWLLIIYKFARSLHTTVWLELGKHKS